MSDYRRLFHPGGTYFFTLVTHQREPFLIAQPARECLRTAIDLTREKRPFEIVAIVLLPDHLHTIWKLPEGDFDFPRRWAAIKSQFSRLYLDAGGSESARSESRLKRGERGFWQRRFWEHRIRDVDDLGRHLNYIHYNPVKHGLVRCPHWWQYSSFARFCEREDYSADWICVCNERIAQPPDFSGLCEELME